MAILEHSSPGDALPVRLGGADALASLLPAHDDLLTAAECEALAREVAARGLWEGVDLTPTESHTRAYALLHEDERMEMWLLSWLPRHSTGFHDHGESSVGFCVAQGTLVERHLRFAEPPHVEALATGDSRSAGCDYIHCLEWESGAPALSVHVYSPPLRVVGQYRHGDDGILRRETQPGRDELTQD